LSSYIQRLAVANGTLPSPLLHRLVAWQAEANPAAIGTWKRRTGVVRFNGNLNGFTHADHWVRVLSVLTQRADLIHLTTRAWDRLFSTRHFLKPMLAWCPLCLREDRTPYHRLLWTLFPAAICLRHSVPLATRCPICARTLPVIHERSAVTHCPWCASDLRNAVPPACTVDANSFEAWSACELGKVVAAAAMQADRIRWDHKKVLHALIKSQGLRNAAEFARFVGVSKITGWYWWTGEVRPSLFSWLRIFFRFGSSFSAHLCSLDHELKTVCGQQEIYLPPLRQPRKINWLKARKHLESEITLPLESAHPFLAVARELQIAPRLLRRHEPQLCRKIGRRYREKCRRDAHVRTMALRKRILSACRQLVSVGLPITPQNVSQQLRSPGLFCRHNARQLFKAVISSRR
ncbi:MAG TPA: TniQ family protein, partial [Opitutaceae bacterium]|nr:TniQ family protein [Opitutaceae bacterium]